MLPVHADAPKILGDASLRAARLAQIHEPHVASLTAFVDALRIEGGAGVEIPYFDPWDGGIEAEVLFLLEAPGPRAVSSGFVSRNNSDETAKNFFEIAAEAGLPRKKTILWNAVPWYIGTGARIRAATPKDLETGLQPLPRLLKMLPKLRLIVFMGRKAESARARILQSQPDLQVLSCPHPSPMFVNRSPENREKIREVFSKIARLNLV